jgi:hypothetical protein
MGFYVEDYNRKSSPLSETGMQAFECYLSAKLVWIYVTVHREGGNLLYNCYRDKDVRLNSFADHLATD